MTEPAPAPAAVTGISEGEAAVPWLLAVDGGNSKTDVLVLDIRGSVLAHVRGPSVAPVHFGVDGAMDRLDVLVAEALGDARVAVGHAEGSPPAAPAQPLHGVFALAGADLPHEEAALSAACAQRGWCRTSVVCNDVFALLSLGTAGGTGVAVICGAGINAVGVRPDGATVRFPALGGISGDWGGGYDVGMAALGAAVRDQDGRGPVTVLRSSVPEHFGMADPVAVMTAIHLGEVDELRVVELPPLLFDAARDGDSVAVAVVERLGAEVVALASAALRRLSMTGGAPEVVLGGGLLRARLPLLDRVVVDGVLTVAPGARIRHVSADPVVGSALRALSDVGAGDDAAARLRAGAFRSRTVTVHRPMSRAGTVRP